MYIQIYDKFETAVCHQGLTEGKIKPLKEKGEITLIFESATDGVVQDCMTFDDNTHSCINIHDDVIPHLVRKSLDLWKDVSQESLIIMRPQISKSYTTPTPVQVVTLVLRNWLFYFFTQDILSFMMCYDNS